MTFLIPLLGLRVRRHSGVHLSLFADNDDDFYSQSEDNQDLAPDTESNMFPRLKVRFLRMTWDF